MELCWMSPSCLVAFIVSEDAMQAVGGEKSHPTVNYDINLPGNMSNSGTELCGKPTAL